MWHFGIMNISLEELKFNFCGNFFYVCYLRWVVEFVISSHLKIFLVKKLKLLLNIFLSSCSVQHTLFLVILELSINNDRPNCSQDLFIKSIFYTFARI